MEKVRILGIDPGIAIVGWGVVDVINSKPKVVSYGVITTEKELSLPERLKIIDEDLLSIIEKYKPDEISMEELFFNTNQKTGIMVAEARGVILLRCFSYTNKLFEYTPLQIKQALTGYGRAEKKQIQEMTKTFLGLKSIPKPDDAADALAVALAHSQTSKLKGIFSIR